MADEQHESPFTRPGFVTAAVVVGLIAVLGTVIGVLGGGRDSRASSPPAASPAASQPPKSEGSTAGPSVCGLPGEVLSGTLPAAPEADWAYQGTIAYPTSREYGPAKTSPAGFRYCYQHSPEGALFATANAVAQGTDARTLPAWLDYFVAQGPNRKAFLSAGSDPVSASGIRLAVAGFRLLEYSGETATVDVALEGSSNGQPGTLSMIYKLTWQDGDWKLVVNDPSTPIDATPIPDLAGYVTWGLSYG